MTMKNNPSIEGETWLEKTTTREAEKRESGNEVERHRAEPISTPELFSRLRERRALGNPETKCLLTGFREEQSKSSLIGAFISGVHSC